MHKDKTTQAKDDNFNFDLWKNFFFQHVVGYISVAQQLISLIRMGKENTGAVILNCYADWRNSRQTQSCILLESEWAWKNYLWKRKKN